METGTARLLDRECPHCEGEGSVIIPLPASGPLPGSLGGAGMAMEVCAHGVRRRLVPAGRRRPGMMAATRHAGHLRRAREAERDYLYLRDLVARLEGDLAAHRADRDACLREAETCWRLARGRART